LFELEQLQPRFKSFPNLNYNNHSKKVNLAKNMYGYRGLGILGLLSRERLPVLLGWEFSLDCEELWLPMLILGDRSRSE